MFHYGAQKSSSLFIVFHLLQVKLKQNFILLFFKKVLIYNNCIKYDIVPGCRRFGEDIFDILWVVLQPGGWAVG
jgi:hypothetical protein